MDSGLEQVLHKQTLANGDLEHDGKPGHRNQLKPDIPVRNGRTGITNTSKNLSTPLSHATSANTEVPNEGSSSEHIPMASCCNACQCSLLQQEGLGRGRPSQLRELSSPCEPQPWPFLLPAQSLRGMIQQKPGSHQLLLQPESSEVSLGSLADLCNQGEVVWGARRMRDRLCGARGNGGELSRVLLGVKNIISSLESLWLCPDKGWVMQKQ